MAVQSPLQSWCLSWCSRASLSWLVPGEGTVHDSPRDRGGCSGPGAPVWPPVIWGSEGTPLVCGCSGPHNKSIHRHGLGSYGTFHIAKGKQKSPGKPHWPSHWAFKNPKNVAYCGDFHLYKTSTPPSCLCPLAPLPEPLPLASRCSTVVATVMSRVLGPSWPTLCLWSANSPPSAYIDSLVDFAGGPA